MRIKRRRFDSYPGSRAGGRTTDDHRPTTAEPPREPYVSHANPAAVIVLAAGSGTRMKSKRSKVLH